MLEPWADYIIVKPLSAEEISASGIIIPDTVSKERPERGEVVAVGQGRQLENGSLSLMGAKVGDKIIFKKYAPDEIKEGKTEYLAIKMDDVIAFIK